MRIRSNLIKLLQLFLISACGSSSALVGKWTEASNSLNIFEFCETVGFIQTCKLRIQIVGDSISIVSRFVECPTDSTSPMSRLPRPRLSLGPTLIGSGPKLYGLN